jgi:3-deoxy-D-manno-octulosonate 8-phosphate phosphatase (KDO 8-P phosphatase)
MTRAKELEIIQLVAFDFDGVFTDNRVITNQEGTESVVCWRSDGLGLSRIIKLGVRVIIVSTESNPVVSMRAAKLKVTCLQSVEDKAGAILEICRNYGIPPEHTMFVGNDINDIPAFRVVGYPVAVADAYPEVYPYVLFRTKKPGGLGAVREICDLIYNAKSSLNSLH